jgi:hypothetical protein
MTKSSRGFVRARAQKILVTGGSPSEINGLIRGLTREWRRQGKRLKRWIKTMSRLEALTCPRKK